MKLLVTTAAFVIAVSTQAAEFHVAKDGNNTNAGSVAKRLLTIQRAANLAQPADKLRLYREVSPVNYLRKESPPLLMIQGDKDTTIPVHHAYYMQEKAQACAAPVEIFIVKNAGHNWREVDAPIDPSTDDIIQRTVDFLVAELSRGKALK